MRQTVVGIFDSESEAQNAVQKLVNDGFLHDNIDISGQHGNYQSQQNDYQTTNSERDEDFGDKVSNFFSNLFGGDNDEARNYSQVGKKGCIVTVHADSEEEAERAVDILDLYGAVDVDERAQSYSSSTGSPSYRSDDSLTSETKDYSNRGSFSTDDISATPDYSSDQSFSTEDTVGNRSYNKESFRDDMSEDDIKGERSIPIVEEQMNVGKREVETGGVRIRSRIVERPVEENMRLRVERVNVERNPVNRPANEADFNTFREGTIEVTSHEEVPVVNKEARVVEEVSVGKQVEERTETIRDKVRKTEVDVENFDSDKNQFDSDKNRFKDRDNLTDDI